MAARKGIHEKANPGKDEYWEPGWWMDANHKQWIKGRIEFIAKWMINNPEEWKNYTDVARTLHCSKSSVVKAHKLTEN
jgi:hypothetical protein